MHNYMYGKLFMYVCVCVCVLWFVYTHVYYNIKCYLCGLRSVRVLKKLRCQIARVILTPT